MEETNTQQTVETTDNSESINIQEEVSKALDEPETSTETTVEKDNVQSETVKQDECPDKFRNNDGSVNVDKLTKSYKELEPLINEKAEWQKERAELLKSKEQLDAILNQQNEQNEIFAKERGYNSTQEMQKAYEIANYEANEYAKYLQYIDEEDRNIVERMLVDYANNPSDELMRDIELEFPPEVNKRIAVQSYQLEQNFNNQAIESNNVQRMTNLENIIKQSVEADEKIFDYEPFHNLYVNTLQKYGDNFTFEDSMALINTFNQMKDLYRKEFEKEYGIENENKKATDKLASISASTSAPAVTFEKDINKISKQELSALVSKFI